jgi:hypothetical protein
MSSCLCVWKIVLASLILMPLNGCARKPAPLVAASGTMLDADGLPLASVHVMFYPLDEGSDCVKLYKSIPFCITGPKGDFSMVMSADKVGIPAGRYQVMAKAIDSNTGPQIPSRYKDHDTSPWQVTVPEGGRTDILLKLERS